MTEIWKKIPGFDKYEISNYANIKNIIKNKILNPHIKNSYYSIALFDNNGKRKGCLLHRLVAITFLPNIDNKPTVNHKNSVSLDNRLDNLEWATYKEQTDNQQGIPTNVKELISSRRTLLKNIITNEEIEFETSVYACKYIFEQNIVFFKQHYNYDNFEEAKIYIKNKLGNTIRNKINNGILFEKYEPKYIQSEILDNEIWEKIPLDLINNTENCYVSTLGRIKNSKGRITNGFLHTNGYIKVSLSQKSYVLHRLVAQVFIKNPDNKPQVNHIDGKKNNNYVENLEWVNSSENCIHRSNEIHIQNLKKVYQYDLQMNLIKVYKSITEASKETNIPKELITSCCNENQVKTNNFIFRFEYNKGNIRINKWIKPVIQYDLQMNYISEFNSIKEASIKLKLNNSCISDCCKGNQKTSGGFIFEYK